MISARDVLPEPPWPTSAMFLSLSTISLIYVPLSLDFLDDSGKIRSLRCASALNGIARPLACLKPLTYILQKDYKSKCSNLFKRKNQGQLLRSCAR
jgi:hypothetical protein